MPKVTTTLSAFGLKPFMRESPKSYFFRETAKADKKSVKKFMICSFYFANYLFFLQAEIKTSALCTTKNYSCLPAYGH